MFLIGSFHWSCSSLNFDRRYSPVENNIFISEWRWDIHLKMCPHQKSRASRKTRVQPRGILFSSGEKRHCRVADQNRPLIPSDFNWARCALRTFDSIRFEQSRIRWAFANQPMRSISLRRKSDVFSLDQRRERGSAIVWLQLMSSHNRQIKRIRTRK